MAFAGFGIGGDGRAFLGVVGDQIPQRPPLGRNREASLRIRDQRAVVETRVAEFVKIFRAECVVEIEDPSGVRMRIEVKGLAPPDLVALTRSLRVGGV